MKEESQVYQESIPKEFIERIFVKGQCEADCRAPVHRGGQIWCLGTKGCDDPCTCVLFRLSKDWGNDPDDFDEDPPWERMEGGKHPYEPDEYYYRCWCVK